MWQSRGGGEETQSSLITEDGPRKQTKPRYSALPLKVVQRKGVALRGTDVREGETGEGESNTRLKGTFGGDTLQGTHFHSVSSSERLMFLCVSMGEALHM